MLPLRTQGDGKIAPWQGFWVKSNAENPVLTFTDQVRSNGGVFLKENPSSTLFLTLKGNGQRSSAIVSLQENASTTKDRYDTYKLQSLNANYLSLFTQLPVPVGEDGSGFDINALPLDFEESLSIPLGMDGSDLSGEFELSWNPKNLPEGMNIVLVDKKTRTEVDLTEASSYSFNIENQAKVIQSLPAGRGRRSDESTPARIQPIHGVFSPK